MMKTIKRAMIGATAVSSLIVALARQEASGAAAVPTITGVSGTLAHGGSLTITGSGFGTKSSAAPIKYDDFDNGALNTTIANGWDVLHASNITYSNTVLRPNSTRSARSFAACGETGNFGFIAPNPNGIHTSTLYLDWWARADWTTTFPTNYKIMRLFLRDVGQKPDYVFNGLNGQSWILTSEFPTQPSEPPYWNQYTWAQISQLAGTWIHYRWYGKIGDPVTGGGLHYLWTNKPGGNVEYQMVDDPGRSTNWRWIQPGDPTTFNAVLFGNATQGLCNSNIYWDNVYVDNTLAHVAIANASTWAASTRNEVQPATAWNDGAITVTLNQGGFTSLNGPYIYAFDSAGNVSAGYPLGASAPSAPRNLRIIQ
jgi:hypothetical protein